MHGYDVGEPAQLNPERGDETGFRQFLARLRRHDMGLLLDVAPKQMATGRENWRRQDVLAHG
jgi:(1->4)-alpha-D-glucan 1-alpha-D-glucosylmutase